MVVVGAVAVAMVVEARVAVVKVVATTVEAATEVVVQEAVVVRHHRRVAVQHGKHAHGGSVLRLAQPVDAVERP